MELHSGAAAADDTARRNWKQLVMCMIDVDDGYCCRVYFLRYGVSLIAKKARNIVTLFQFEIFFIFGTLFLNAHTHRQFTIIFTYITDLKT